jgi:hypothetical protein
LFLNKINVRILSNHFLFTAIISCGSCATTNKINALKPEADDAVPLVYENNPSFINLPISVKLKDRESNQYSFSRIDLWGQYHWGRWHWNESLETTNNNYIWKGEEKIKTILPFKSCKNTELAPKNGDEGSMILESLI